MIYLIYQKIRGGHKMEVRPIDSKITKITIALFVLNILAIIVFADRISLTVHDALPALVFATNIWSITATYILKRNERQIPEQKDSIYHIKHYIFRRARLPEFFSFSPDKDLREKKFDLMLVIYCSLLPFYLPTAFLTYKLQCVIPTIVLFFIPTLVSQIYDMIYFFTTAHKNKLIQQQKDAQYEKERLEQERREELGKWK